MLWSAKLAAVACIILACCSYSLVWTATAATTAPSSDRAAQDIFQACPFPSFDEAVQRFSRVLSFRTVSDVSSEYHVRDAASFQELDAFLPQAYSKVWQHLTVEKLGDGSFSYLLTWQGSDASLAPALFISHVDVVPVTKGTEQDWKHPPFSGAVADGFIWGRGALDVKVGVVGLLEAANALLECGYSPRRTLLLAFGHDEEVGGTAGAARIAAKLAASGTRLEFIWDEGGMIYAEGMPPFTHLPVALVATAEKFYQQVGVTLEASGGHSSMPPIDGSSIGDRLGAFLSAMTASPPQPHLVAPTRELLEGLLDLAGSKLAVLAWIIKATPTSWLDRLLAVFIAKGTAPLAALLRDTAAVTILRAGVAENVLPQTADVSINFRLLPSSSPADALRYVKQWLGPNAAHATIALRATEAGPSSVADSKGLGFRVIKEATQKSWKFSDAAGAKYDDVGVPVLPYLVPGGTDSKHYQNLTDTILRIAPYSLTQELLATVHATNERISVADFQRLLCTYRTGLMLAGEGEQVVCSQPGTATLK